MAKKPFIEAREVSPFGDVDPNMTPLTDPTRDIYDLPGYSDKRRERELQIARGERPDPLQCRIQLVPTARVSGKPDRRKEQEYRNLGYSPMTEEKAKELGIDLENSAYEVQDGLVTLNENIAMWAPREVAARNLAKLNNLNERQREAARAKVEDAVDKFNRESGLKESAGGSKAIFEIE